MPYLRTEKDKPARISEPTRPARTFRKFRMLTSAPKEKLLLLYLRFFEIPAPMTAYFTGRKLIPARIS